MPNYLTEAKPQCWRALAIFEDGTERLIYLGLSSKQIRENYQRAFFDVLDDEEQDQAESVAMQKWVGAPDAGRWTTHSTLNMPTAMKLARTA